MSLNEVHLNTEATPESYTGTLVTKTKVALPPVVEQDGFPRFTRGQYSGAVFLMINQTFGYSITDGTNCFLPLGEVVTSMAGMVEYHDEDGKYDEHLAHHVGIYQTLYDNANPTTQVSTLTTEPVATEPVATEPVATEPVATEPVAA